MPAGIVVSAGNQVQTPAIPPEAAEIRGPVVDYQVFLGLPGLIRSVSETKGDQIALVDGQRSLTYRQLELASDVVAARVAAERPGSDTPIAVCIPRRCELVVALLGVLKAGRCYLPIAHDEPTARRELIVRQAKPELMLVVDETSVVAAAHPSTRGIEVGDVLTGIYEPSGPMSALHAVPADQAVYVLFTSGSTGEPKGVVVPSGAVCNRLLWMRDEYGFSPADRILQKTPCTFDVSVWEIFGPLIAGAICVLADPGAHRDPGRLIQTIVTNQVTICHFVPSMLTEFLRWPDAARCVSLRLIVSSGEALSAALVRQCTRALPAQLDNLYGPTEAAIDVTHWPCPQNLPPGAPVLIGNPIANCVLLVLDEAGQPVRAGESGQLCIGGTPLALGYMGRTDLTALAFCAAPSWSSVKRLYRTGDRVRVRAEGLEYVGRTDEQVKIRGHRVEPQEIEHHLQDHPDLAQSAVVAITVSGETTLVAFIVPTCVASSSGPDPHLRTWLARLVPAAFVPAEFVILAEMPHTSSGKQDRDRLRRIATGRLPAARSHSRPDPLTHAWQAALRLSRVDPAVPFSQAGGHSLAAIRLVSEIRDKWGMRIELPEFVRQDPTLTELRTLIGARKRCTRVEIPRRADSTRAALGIEQFRMWRYRRRLPDFFAYNVFGALVMEGTPKLETLTSACADLITRHESLRTTIAVDDDGRPYQRIWSSCPPPLRHVATTEPLSEQIEAFCRAEADTEFDPGRLPMWSIAVLTCAQELQWCLIVTLDHLIADQIALELVFADLTELYEAGLEGRQPLLAALSIQPGDISEWEANDQPNRRGIDNHAYWCHRLADAPRGLDLVSATSGAEIGSPTAAVARRFLELQDSADLRDLVRRHRVTPATFFLAAYAAVLAELSGTADVVVGVSTSVRDRAESQPLVGQFITLVPVRLHLDPATSMRESLIGVRDALIEATEHAGRVDFAALEQELRQPDGAPPFYQMWFNDLTPLSLPSSFGGAPARQVPIAKRWSVFKAGLTVSVLPGGEYQLDFAHPISLPMVLARQLLDQCLRRVHQMLRPRLDDNIG